LVESPNVGVVVVQIAVFDTSFHATMPSKAFLYAIPKGLYKEHGIRRYGFHGSSYEYVCETASKSLGLTGKLNAIIIYLGEEGEGSSACVVKDGKCIDTSMGLTPLEGAHLLCAKLRTSHGPN
jgi:acetate kinase